MTKSGFRGGNHSFNEFKGILSTEAPVPNVGGADCGSEDNEPCAAAGDVCSAGCTEQADGEDRRQGKPDWSSIDRDVLEVLRQTPVVRVTNTHVEYARGGVGLRDAVQEGIIAVLASPPLPETHGEAVELIAKHSRRTWRSWTKRMREQRCNLDLYAPTLSTRDLFEIVCARDEQMVLLERLYQALEEIPEAKMVLFAILDRGFLFHETRLIAEELHLDDTHVGNLKRRIVRKARTIMIELTSPHMKGGAA